MKQKTGWDAFLELCLELKTTKDFDAFFDLILTPEEKDQLACRCMTLKELLLEKQTQRQISESLKVSIAQITRGSNALKRADTKTKKFILNILGE